VIARCFNASVAVGFDLLCVLFLTSCVTVGSDLRKTLSSLQLQGLNHMIDKAMKGKLKKLVNEKIANPRSEGELTRKKRLESLNFVHFVIPTNMAEEVSYK
jgi:hypothetical protein